MNAGDVFLIVVCVGVTWGASWIAYLVGRDSAERKAAYTISGLRRANRIAREEADTARDRSDRLANVIAYQRRSRMAALTNAEENGAR